MRRLVLGLSIGAVLASLACCVGSLAVMSIDLGNEYFKIGLVKPGVPMEIVLNVDSQRKTQTMVSMRSVNEREFGNPAANTAVKYPASSFWYLRELLAKNTSNPIVQAFQQRFPYYILEDDLERATVNFVHPDGSKYSVEELLAMILESAKVYAEKFAEQPINDVVIVSPAYFNQAERRALIRSAELAGLKVLQLMNSHAAVALNYGVFRRKEFNSTAQNFMFFDMGSTSTIVAIASYQVVKMKVGTMAETNPQVTIKGLGIDRTLGSLEITLRIRDHLAKVFTEKKKTKNDLYKNNRAMAKLLKEAERVKKILSANTDCYAQIENLMDDEDFRAPVSRRELETMSADIFERIAKPIEDALASSELTMSEIQEVILKGGGTRVPKVQEILKKTVGRQELGKSINTDEAAALGAVYQAAHLSTGFKVKTFAVKDANMYPIQVDFERNVLADDGTPTTKTVKRTLFSRNNPYPQKKVMTFNKHTDDFEFEVNYGDLGFMNDVDRQAFGSIKLSSVNLEGVRTQIEKNVDNQTECKGVKAHFNLDGSGLVNLDSVEVVFERAAGAVDEKSTLSKLSETISSFFSSNDEKAGDDASAAEAGVESGAETDAPKQGSEETGENTGDDKLSTEEKTTPETEEKPSDSQENADKKSGEDNSNKTEKADNTTQSLNQTAEAKESKPTIIKRKLTHTLKIVDLEEPATEALKASRGLIEEFARRDLAKLRLAAVQNDLESFCYDVKSRVWEDVDWEVCSTEAQREEIVSKIGEIMEWYDDQGVDTPYEEYEAKLTAARDAVKELKGRVQEYQERPKVMETLRSMLNQTKYMIKTFKNFSLPNTDSDDKPFTEVEIQTLESLYKETSDWKKQAEKDQLEKAAHAAPAFTVLEAAEKLRALDREIKYLLNKAKVWKPKKPKVTIKDDMNGTKSENGTESDDKTTNDDKAAEAENTIEKPDVDADPQEGTPHTDEQETTEETLQLDSASSEDSAVPEDPEESNTDTTPHGEL